MLISNSYGKIEKNGEKKTQPAKMINDQGGKESKRESGKNCPGSCKMTMGTNVISA